jgi:dTDP-4-amino-4,6-dideoxygalactose transaminase
MDVSNIEGAITEVTKAIVPVHFGGHPVDIGRLSGIARKNGIKVIEDGCHALGASYRAEEIDKWTKIGSCTHSDMTVFSFHPVKHITTGEGGAVMTNSRDYYERLIMFRNHGITKKAQDFIAFNPSTDGPWYYEQQLLGYNYRMTDIQAALGLSQLKKLDGFVEKRREIAERYSLAFSTATAFQIPLRDHMPSPPGTYIH